MSEKFRFPKRFLWGVASSAHQVEGGNHNNWSVWELQNARALAKAASYKQSELKVWPEIKKQASTPNNYVSGRAVDHYNRYEEDFEIARKMSLNAFRFSIEWSRIEPEEGRWDAAEIEHYRKYIHELKRRGLEPVMTLYHWTVPVWFAEKGGFEQARNIQYFVRYAEKVLSEIGKDIRLIVTINEPDTVVSHGYYLLEHPPQKRSLWKAFWVYRNLLKGHKLIYQRAHRISRRFKVGFVKSYSHVVALDDRRITRFMVWWNLKTRDSLPLGYVGRHMDFIGVNYYFTDAYQGRKLIFGANIYHEADSDRRTSDLGWEMYPDNLEPVLIRLARWRKPLIVTETGVADVHDRYRKEWLNGTIRAVNNALEKGVKVEGYLYWSLTDNFEWAYGKWPCFGLVGIDYDNDLKRVPRRSALYYAAFVKKMRGI